MAVHSTCTRKCVVAMTAFVSLFSIVRFQMCPQTVRVRETVSSHGLHFGIPPPDSRIDNAYHTYICATTAFVILQGKGNHLQKVTFLHILHLLHLQPLYHHFISVCRCSWGGTSLWWPATLSWAATDTVTFTSQFVHWPILRKNNWGANDTN